MSLPLLSTHGDNRTMSHPMFVPAPTTPTAPAASRPTPGAPVPYGGPRPVVVGAACWAITAKAVLGVACAVLAIWFRGLGAFVGPASIALGLVLTLLLVLPLGITAAGSAGLDGATLVVAAVWIGLTLAIRARHGWARVTTAVLLIVGTVGLAGMVLFHEPAAAIGDLAIGFAMATAAALLLSSEAREWTRR